MIVRTPPCRRGGYQGIVASAGDRAVQFGRAEASQLGKMITRRTSMPARLLPALRSLVAALALAAAFVPSLFAAGFGLDFEGARALGNATAGSASAADATTIFYN